MQACDFKRRISPANGVVLKRQLIADLKPAGDEPAPEAHLCSFVSILGFVPYFPAQVWSESFRR